jgi:hypothetical protein
MFRLTRISFSRLAARGLLPLVTIAGMNLTTIPAEGRARSEGTHPPSGTTLDLRNGVLSVALDGDLAYIVTSEAGPWVSVTWLSTYDLSSPAPQVPLGSVYFGYGEGSSDMLAVAGGFVYLVTWGFVVVDASDPADPRVVATLAWPERPACVAAAGTCAYVGDTAGLHVLDVADPTSPSLLGSVALSSAAVTVALRGTLALVGTLDARVAVVDVSDPHTPVVVSTLALPGTPWDIQVTGAHAYVSDGEAGLQILDLSRPALPRLAGGVDTPGDARTLAVSGARAYVVDRRPGSHWGAVVTDLRVIEVSNPMHPVIVNSITGVDRAGNVYGFWDTSEDRGIVASNGRVVVGGSILHQWVGGDCVGGLSGCDELSGYLAVTPRSAFEPPSPGAGLPVATASSATSVARASDTSGTTTSALRGNDPNPFNPETSIHFETARPSWVRVQVYDARGQLVRTLVDEALPAGSHTASWRGRSESGQEVASGVYFVLMEAENTRQTKKITLSR